MVKETTQVYTCIYVLSCYITMYYMFIYDHELICCLWSANISAYTQFYSSRTFDVNQMILLNILV
jgi:hypothetical protein